MEKTSKKFYKIGTILYILRTIVYLILCLIFVIVALSANKQGSSNKPGEQIGEAIAAVVKASFIIYGIGFGILFIISILKILLGIKGINSLNKKKIGIHIVNLIISIFTVSLFYFIGSIFAIRNYKEKSLNINQSSINNDINS
jgi:hypothetical protein